jgi:rhodanese-related sulfurtransferase
MVPDMTIDPNITMHELLEQMPGAQRALFRKYHIGGCSSCGFRPDETLSGVCARNDGLPVNEVIDYLLASHEEDKKMQIEPAELAQLRANNTPLQLLDIRTREEFDAAKIEGSTLFTQELMQQILGSWDRNSPFVLIDHQGKRSMDAAAFFLGHGFTEVKALRGGIDAWSAEIDASVPRYELEQA